MHTINYIIKHPLPLQTLNLTQLRISKIFLSFLILNININGPDFFKLRELSFVLFVFTALPYGNYKKLWTFFISVAIYLITSILNCVISGSDATPLEAFKYMLGFFYLYLLVYDIEEYRLTLQKTFIFSTTITALMIISIWSLCMLSSSIKIAMTTLFSEEIRGKTAFVFMIRDRKILNWWFLGVYFGTAPAMIPSLGYFLFKNIKRGKVENKLLIFIHILGLIMTGARANILAAILIVFIFICFKLYSSNRIILSTSLFSAVLLFSIIVVFLLLSDRTESSLTVKNLHKHSYFKEFTEHPFRYLFIGAGGGSTFYSEGYRMYTSLTELTVYETIRRYGLIGTTILFSVIWINPILKVLANTFSIKAIYYCIVVLAYIFVACTNPFLFGSIGFLTLFFFKNVSNPLIEDNKNRYI